VSACERLLHSRFQYQRQYFGFSRRGTQLIYVNGLCRTADTPYWRTNFVSVADGGDCYYQATYDPVAHSFVECQVNGVA